MEQKTLLRGPRSGWSFSQAEGVYSSRFTFPASFSIYDVLLLLPLLYRHLPLWEDGLLDLQQLN